MDQANIAFQGEVMLLNWSESSTRGRTATLLLADDGDAHPFRDFTIKHGKKAGQRFMCVLVEIGSDEQPVKQHKTLSQQAYLLCRDQLFWEWADQGSFDHIDSEDAARAYICTLTNITSRSDLDVNAHAAAVFTEQILAPFNSYKAKATAVVI